MVDDLHVGLSVFVIPALSWINKFDETEYNSICSGSNIQGLIQS